MVKEQAYALSRMYMHRPVRVHTSYGHLFDGIIVGVDSEYVYMKMRPQPYRAPFFPGYPYAYNPNNDILTLSLFTLLAIYLTM
ncbi:hypothetical protein [Paenibacillus sp. y28]|uniref:hypothetical protein n=1 Tax=Paenibacillus sp. y28 TaxID=3129110 RepID=UPI00301733E7